MYELDSNDFFFSLFLTCGELFIKLIPIWRTISSVLCKISFVFPCKSAPLFAFPILFVNSFVTIKRKRENEKNLC